MREFLPVLIVGAIIGAFSLVFIMAYIAISKQKDDSDSDRHMKDIELVKRLIHYAIPHWKSFILVFIIMIFSIAANLGSTTVQLPSLSTFVLLSIFSIFLLNSLSSISVKVYCFFNAK